MIYGSVRCWPGRERAALSASTVLGQKAYSLSLRPQACLILDDGLHVRSVRVAQQSYAAVGTVRGAEHTERRGENRQGTSRRICRVCAGRPHQPVVVDLRAAHAELAQFLLRRLNQRLPLLDDIDGQGAVTKGTDTEKRALAGLRSQFHRISEHPSQDGALALCPPRKVEPPIPREYQAQPEVRISRG